jgi:dihydroxyacetone kinase-like protein
MVTSSLDRDAVAQMLLFMADRVIAAEPILSEADRHLGDGDHGLGMARGFSAVKTRLRSERLESIAKLFGVAGTVMLSTMGGASGALFGTMFRNGGKALEGRSDFDSGAWADFLEAAVAGVRARGGAQPGEKTMIDALQPAALKARELAGVSLPEAAIAVAAAARSGQEASKAMLATVGRAKALGAASIGFPDPGAMSVTVILEAVRDYVLARSHPGSRGA